MIKCVDGEMCWIGPSLFGREDRWMDCFALFRRSFGVCVPGGLETGVRGGCIELLIPEIDCGRNDSFEMVRPAIR